MIRIPNNGRPLNLRHGRLEFVTQVIRRFADNFQRPYDSKCPHLI